MPELNQWQKDELNSLVNASHAADYVDYGEVERERKHTIRGYCQRCETIYDDVKKVLERD